MEKLLNFIREALKVFCCVVLTLMSVIVFMQVVNRNIFGGSFVWVEELAGMCMVGITFLGAALATSTNAHTRIDFIILKLPKRGTKIMYMLGNAVCAAFVCVLGYYSIPLIRQTINSLTPRLKLPYALNYIVVLLSAVLMLIYFIALIVKDAKELRTIPKGAKNDLNESLEISMEAEMGDNVHIDGVEEEDK
ncbi:MAG: TRAP transporter small permease [Oscillospiraceae bacterium]